MTTSAEQLSSTITNIDHMSQLELAEISTLAKLALSSIEHKKHDQLPMGLKEAIQLIWGKSGMLMNDINCAAEDVGCHYSDR